MKKYFAELMTKNGKKRILPLACICLMVLASGTFAGCASAGAGSGEATSSAVDESSAAGADAMVVEEMIEETVPADNMEVQGIMNAFVTAYFAGDVDTIEQYLSESYGQEVEVYGDPEHADEVQINGFRGASFDLQGNIGDECELSVEFVSPGEDSLTCLTVGFVKEESGWKISSYGVEK